MIEEKTWKEFRESGLLWMINTTLHIFGWSIVVEMDDNGDVVSAKPCRVKFRGFTEDVNTKMYKNVTKYMNENSAKLLEECD